MVIYRFYIFARISYISIKASRKDTIIEHKDVIKQIQTPLRIFFYFQLFLLLYDISIRRLKYYYTVRNIKKNKKKYDYDLHLSVNRESNIPSIKNTIRYIVRMKGMKRIVCV